MSVSFNEEKVRLKNCSCFDSALFSEQHQRRVGLAQSKSEPDGAGLVRTQRTYGPCQNRLFRTGAANGSRFIGSSARPPPEGDRRRDAMGKAWGEKVVNHRDSSRRRQSLHALWRSFLGGSKTVLL